ncbi:MAG: hypothetical protein ABFS03_12230, partial [Chloroflexota bacterium]
NLLWTKESRLKRVLTRAGVILFISSKNWRRKAYTYYKVLCAVRQLKVLNFQKAFYHFDE